MATRTSQLQKNKGIQEGKEKLHWEKVILELSTEELELYRQVADHFGETLADHLVCEIRDSNRGILDNPEFLGSPLSEKLLARLKTIMQLAEKQKPATADIVALSVRVDRKRWDRFMKLPKPVRDAYINRVIDDCVQGLFDDPKMLGWYMSQYAKQ